MASQTHLITLYCKETNEYYTTRANKKRRASFANRDIKLKLRKYSKKLRKVVEFVETKKIFKKK